MEEKKKGDIEECWKILEKKNVREENEKKKIVKKRDNDTRKIFQPVNDVHRLKI